MIVGEIVGKSTTLNFEFLVKQSVKKFDYVQVCHPENGFVLCQVVDLLKYDGKTLARCNVLGFRDDKIMPIRVPFDPGSEVLAASDEFVAKTIRIEGGKESAHIGKLRGKEIDVFLDLRKSLARHISVLAKSGSGKSYFVGVLLEELLEKNVPTLVIDPHGEYHTLKYPCGNAKSYVKQLQEYGDPTLNPAVRPIKLHYDLSADELIHLLPTRLNSTQQALLYSALKSSTSTDFDSLMVELEMEQNPAKYAVINMIDYIKRKQIFSLDPTPYNELISPGKCSLINLKGIEPEIQQIIVYKLMADLFEERKNNRVPPFFAVVEEAHNYCPERSFGEAKSSRIFRTIASEGRKFGLGLCVVSQRPSRVDKSVLSQCNTQVIMKVSNRHDLHAISQSVEGLTTETENEIKNLAVGEAIVTGVVDMPLFVQIRPRRTKHGGEQVNIVQLQNIVDSGNLKALPLILPFTSKKDLELMSEGNAKISTTLIPAVLLDCGDFRMLIDLAKGQIIHDVEKQGIDIPNLGVLSPSEMKILQVCKDLSNFSPADVMAKAQVDFSLANSVCNNLHKKGLLVKNGKYNLKDGLVFDLGKYQFTRNIEYKSVDYDKKLTTCFTVASVKERLRDFVKVKSEKECFIVVFEANNAPTV
ncbi:MAG: ATP-binding protein [Candidatus Woesearchaeota archaeon]